MTIFSKFFAARDSAARTGQQVVCPIQFSARARRRLRWNRFISHLGF